MAKRMINELQSLIRKLQAEREAHIEAVAAIDETFEALGISAESEESVAAAQVSRRKKAVKGAAVSGGKFKTSGAAAILSYVSKAGAKGVTSGQIDRYWKSQGRGGHAYNTLGQLVEEKKIKRQESERWAGGVCILWGQGFGPVAVRFFPGEPPLERCALAFFPTWLAYPPVNAAWKVAKSARSMSVSALASNAAAQRSGSRVQIRRLPDRAGQAIA